jgi:hypothetical protein
MKTLWTTDLNCGPLHNVSFVYSIKRTNTCRHLMQSNALQFNYGTNRCACSELPLFSTENKSVVI